MNFRGIQNNMLEIDAILIRNFLSFGDSDTVVKLSDLKSCLITGEIVGDDTMSPDEEQSCGAGKSSLVNALLWCIFGRTMHKANPGDKVINWFTKKGCRVEIRLKNGDRLVRTRNDKDGHDDLLYIENGQDISLGTNKMQQEDLNRRLNLDYTIFCGSVFFSQFNKSWMEMSDVTRREALEREFHMDRIHLYAEVAKERSKQAEVEQEKLRAQVVSTQVQITNVASEIDELKRASAGFADEKARRVGEALGTLRRLEENRDAIAIPNIDDLRSKWAAVQKIEGILEQKEGAIYALESHRRQIQSDISIQDRLIEKWSNKIGICSACEQPISEEYIGAKIEHPGQKKAELDVQLTSIGDQITLEKGKLIAIRQQLEGKRPTRTISEAERSKREWDRCNQSVEAQRRAIQSIESEENHYDQSISRLDNRVESFQSQIAEILKTMKKLDAAILHLNYVYRAYSDRRKIKRYILAEYIPYLNERVSYYLDRFGIKLRIEFTDGLGVRSNYWDYDFFSGGERKCVDVVLMLAMMDLHTVMYGSQCNVVVLDEVDGRLDRKYIKMLTEIIRNDLSEKADAILVISHKSDMKGAMASEIRIRKEGDLSQVHEIIR